MNSVHLVRVWRAGKDIRGRKQRGGGVKKKRESAESIGP